MRIAVRIAPAAALLAVVSHGHAQDGALFVEQTARLGSPQPCGGDQEGCYSNYVVAVDLDADEDLDIVFASGGGYYEPGEAQPMAVYLNDGKAQFTEVNASAFDGFAGRLRQVAAGDIDGDGDVDLIAPDGYGLQPDAVFINDGKSPPHFANEGKARLDHTSRAGATRLGDLDGDGDLDLVITHWGMMPPATAGTAQVFANDGKGKFTEIKGAVPSDTQLIGTGPIDADLFDADGDFDLDLVLASREGESLLFANRGDGKFDDKNANLADQPGPYVYGPDVCDVDADGDLDVWLDNGAAPLAEQLVINDGTGKFADETAARVTDAVMDADDNEVQCVDIDDDGDFDALVASLSNNERLLRNERGHFSAMTGVFPEVGDPTLGLDLGDFDGDGRLDVVTAQGEGAPYLNRIYLGTAAQAKDTHAPRIRAIERAPRKDGGKLWLHFAVTDRATSDVGPRVAEARVEVVGGEPVKARFVGGDLFLAPLTIGTQKTIRARVCAVDMAGLETCSPEQNFFIEHEEPVEPEPEGKGKSDGCSLAPAAQGSSGWLVGLGMLLLAVRRRRR
jgi:MYXO-CTERM domain-containing protein